MDYSAILPDLRKYLRDKFFEKEIIDLANKLGYYNILDIIGRNKSCQDYTDGLVDYCQKKICYQNLLQLVNSRNTQLILLMNC